jgi:hypothetical protein
VDYKFQVPKSSPPAIELNQIRHRQRSGSADGTVIADDIDAINPMRTKRWFESDSIASINLASSLKIFHEDERPTAKTSSRLKIFDSERGFFGRRQSVMQSVKKMNLSLRRNTVG